MAKPKTASWAKLIIALGDGATPTEAFSSPCGLTSKGIAFSADTSDTNVPDCTNPDLPTWVERVVRGLQGTVSGAGVLALDGLDTWRDFYFSGESRNCRVGVDTPAADGGGYFLGRFVCTKFEVTGNEGDGKMQISIELQNDGEVIWVSAV